MYFSTSATFSGPPSSSISSSRVLGGRSSASSSSCSSRCLFIFWACSTESWLVMQLSWLSDLTFKQENININHTLKDSVSLAMQHVAYLWQVWLGGWQGHWKQAWWSPVQKLARHFEWSQGQCSFSSFSSSPSSLSLVLFWLATDLLQGLGLGFVLCILALKCFTF